MLQRVGQWPVLVKSPPASHRCLAANVRVVSGGQTDGNDVPAIVDGLVEAKQCQIVFECSRVELGVRGDYLDATLDVRIGFVLVAHVELAKSKQKVVGSDTVEEI